MAAPLQPTAALGTALRHPGGRPFALFSEHKRNALQKDRPDITVDQLAAELESRWSASEECEREYWVNEAARLDARSDWVAPVRLFEYTSAADPAVPPVPFAAFDSALWRERKSSGVEVLDLSARLKASVPCTSPNLLAAFVRLLPGDTVETPAAATSHMFFVMQGAGSSRFSHQERGGRVEWRSGDLFTVPACASVSHSATLDASLYWVCDAPLLSYLGVTPTVPRFEPTLYAHEALQEALRKVCADPAWRSRNRNGVLMGTSDTSDEDRTPLQTLTLTHTMWALYNALPAHTVQKPHKHNSVALDLCVSAGPNTYTLMAAEVDGEGNLLPPITRADWTPGSAFVTPPGLWHSHHNESDTDAIVLPVQDAGLHTAMRTLMITFAK